VSSEATGAIADRYATALFELAEQNKALDQVAADLKKLKTMISESPDLRRLIGSPVMSRAEQGGAIASLAKTTKMHDLTKNFLSVVASNRRLAAVSAMADAFLGRLAARRGEVSAQVWAATQLTDSQQNALGAALKKAVGSNVNLDVAVDPSLLGGMVVKVGSRMVDSSLKTKLQRLQLAMKGVG
jgi:F-type H+-transporting ATPase subunit delta